MKQSEMDRNLRQIAKSEAKRRQWKFAAGTTYWTIGPLLFTLFHTARVKEASFHSTLSVKWLALDRVLWQVLDMSSNEDAPFSLHANGAFVLRGQEILDSSKLGLVRLQDVLASEVAISFDLANERANEVAGQITSIDSFLEFAEAQHVAFKLRYPFVLANLCKEKLLIALLKHDLPAAQEVAKARVAAGDSGGFSSGGLSFFERALLLATAGE
jgi:hypothetical protein